MKNANLRPWLRSFYRGNRLRFASALALNLTRTAISLAQAVLLGNTLDAITSGSLADLGQILRAQLLLLACFLVNNALLERCKTAFIRRALAQYKAFAFSRLSEKGVSAFSRENTGRSLSALTNDASSIEQNYLERSFMLFYHCALFAAALALMFYYSWQMAAVAVALSVLPIVVSVGMGERLTRREQAVSRQNERYTSTLQGLLAGFAVIKSFKAEAQAAQLFGRANADLEQSKARRRWWEMLTAILAQCCSLLFQMVLFILGAYLAITGRITSGAVLIVVDLCNHVLTPIRTVPQYWASRKSALGLIEKLAALAGENPGRTGQPIEPILRDAIALKDVSFSYTPERRVLDSISLRFGRGKVYAIVGGSGSGKSTLLSLLMGACDYEGSITIDQTELRTVSTDSLYELISLIGQSVFLFDDTIENNITLFRPFPADQIDRAIRQAGLSALVLQKGLGFPCGENGANLSGGERQRIAIARCLLRQTPVLLVDEATAALDNQTAAQITEAILGLHGLTRIIVTHHLEPSLLSHCDEIIVLREGRVQEQGTLTALLERKGYFYSLYTLATP